MRKRDRAGAGAAEALKCEVRSLQFLQPWQNRLFLLGLDKFRKSDWRSISRNCVISRTPTRVASHAQKYYNRLNSANKDRRWSSIHDITSMNDGDTSTPQGPITDTTFLPWKQNDKDDYA